MIIGQVRNSITGKKGEGKGVGKEEGKGKRGEENEVETKTRRINLHY